jgi:hypothetical protein
MGPTMNALPGTGIALQVVYAWGRTVLGYRLLADRKARVTMGARGGTTFTAPLPDGYPRRFEVLRARKGGGAVLRLGPGMSGQLHVRSDGSGMRDVADVLATPRPRKWYQGRDRGFRDVVLMPGDAGVVFLDAARALKLQLSFVDPPEALPRSVEREPLLVRTTIATAVGLVAALAAIFILAPATKENEVLTQERVTKLVPPVVFEEQKTKAEAKKRDEARKKKEREAAMSKRAKNDEGRLGRQDAKQKETVMPKGRQDILREKVQKTGLLAALGTAKMEGSGLGKLLNEPSADVEQAVTGLAGAKLVAGKGNGGVGVAGTGLGGGGTGFGHIQGSGNLDLGAGRGRGRKGAGVGLAAGKEKEVSVGMATGKGDADGGLTREQVARVVASHKAALQYCYEKELQRSPQLSGAVTLFWVVRPNGTVDRVKTDKTTLENRDVEGCMERQVKNWTFPKSTAETHVSFPFIFRGAP